MQIHTQAIVCAMLSLWDFDKKEIEKIANHFKSMDQSYEYLSLMDSESKQYAKDVWKLFCELNDIEHESANNPFKK